MTSQYHTTKNNHPILLNTALKQTWRLQLLSKWLEGKQKGEGGWEQISATEKTMSVLSEERKDQWEKGKRCTVYKQGNAMVSREGFEKTLYRGVMERKRKHCIAGQSSRVNMEMQLGIFPAKICKFPVLISLTDRPTN